MTQSRSQTEFRMLGTGDGSKHRHDCSQTALGDGIRADTRACCATPSHACLPGIPLLPAASLCREPLRRSTLKLLLHGSSHLPPHSRPARCVAGAIQVTGAHHQMWRSLPRRPRRRRRHGWERAGIAAAEGCRCAPVVGGHPAHGSSRGQSRVHVCGVCPLVSGRQGRRSR